MVVREQHPYRGGPGQRPSTRGNSPRARESRAGRRGYGALLGLGLGLAASGAVAADKEPATPAFTPSLNDFGGTGLLQTPNARLHDSGAFHTGVTYVDPYTHGYVTLQPLPWLEGTFRYTSIDNRSTAQGASFKDKSFDLKLRLLEETERRPSLAVGVRDLAGTALFGSEYVAASKKWHGLDFTLGLAWGNAGARGHFDNPLGYFADGFNTRSGETGQGGTATLDYFQGREVALFGGVEWDTPVDGLRLKLEYDGNDYQSEPLGNRFEVDSPINVGVTYSPWDWLSLTAAWERGNTAMLRVNLSTNLNDLQPVAETDNPPPEVPEAPKTAPADRPQPSAGEAARSTGLRVSAAATPAAGRSGGAARDAAEPDEAAPDGTEPDGAGADRAPPAVAALDAAGVRYEEVRMDRDAVTVVLSARQAAPNHRELAELARDLGQSLGARAIRFPVGGLDGPDVTYRLAQLRRSRSLTGRAAALVAPPGEVWRGAFRARPAPETPADRLFALADRHGLDVMETRIDEGVMTLRVAARASNAGSTAAFARGYRSQAPNGVTRVRVLTVAGEVGSEARSAGFADSGAADRAAPEETAMAVFEAVGDLGMTPLSASFDGDRIDVEVAQGKYRRTARAVGRIARAVVAATPERYARIGVVLVESGAPVTRTTLLRSDVRDAANGPVTAEEIARDWEVASVPAERPGATVENPEAFPAFDWSLSPRLRQEVGGPDTFYFYQIWAQAKASAELTRHLSLNGGLGVNVINNYDEFSTRFPSQLPRVRTDVKRYLEDSPVWIDRLTADYVRRLAPDWYGRVSAGYFERMYAAAGGEVLYRPTGKRWALGLDVNYASKRAFDGLFGLRDYDVVTGHLSAYYDTPYDGIDVTVRAGRYLAKDWGATLEVSKEFDSGIVFGAFATKTNVSAEEFGEGSFDKGLFVSIPLDLFTNRPTDARAATTFRPIQRDGGQRLAVPDRLYGVTDPSGAGRIEGSALDVMD